MLVRLQRAVSIWEVGLKSTGGALTVIKSFHTLVIYRWKLDGTHFYGDSASATQLYFTPEGLPKPIDTLHPDTAKEVMGVWQCASGKTETQMEMMKTKLMAWVTQIEDGKLHRRNACMAFWGTIWQTFKYGLRVMMMTEKQS